MSFCNMIMHYFCSPDGKKFRSKTDLLLHIRKGDLDLNIEDFDFTVRGRGNTPAKKTGQKSKDCSKPKPPKIVIPKVKSTKAKKPKVAKRIRNQTNNLSSPQSQTPASKLIVKFNFRRPTPRQNRKTNLTKLKASRQDSQTSQESELSVNNTFEYHEELSNGETRLTNGLDMEELQMLHGSSEAN